MSSMRPYRFPPLDLLQKKEQSAAVEGATAPDPQAVARAFEQASQRGHEEGYAQGLQSGEQAGHAQGLARGVQEGREQGMQAVRAEFAAACTPVQSLHEQLQQLHADWQASLRKDVIDLVERVARQVVRCELTLQPAQILALVEETLQGMPQRTGALEVYLHPADLQRIRELDGSRIPDWNLLADAALEAGECRIRVGEVEVDAGCKQRLAACMEQVREQLVPEEAA